MRFVGIILIVVAIAAISWETAQSSAENPEGTSPTELALPLLAAFAFTMEPILVRVGFAAGTPVFVGVVCKTATTTGGFVGYLWWRSALPDGRFTLSRDPLWCLAAAVANTLAALTYYAALCVSRVVVVAPVTQTSPLIVAAVAYFLLRHLERIPLRLVTSSVLVVAGAVLVSVFG